MHLPKQLIPMSDGRSLLQQAVSRVRDIVPSSNLYICGSEQHRDVVLEAFETKPRFIGEPIGRDTLAAIGLTSAIIARSDSTAVIAVYPADQLIEPVAEFQEIIDRGYELVETNGHALLTFGIQPDRIATGYGYLKMGERVSEGVFRVSEFREKPNAETAKQYYLAGPERYLWNSGMFVWRASTVLDCIQRYKPLAYEQLMRIADVWNTTSLRGVMEEAYPKLEKVSIDFGVMEPASKDPTVSVVALPMHLRWFDVGSWNSFGKTLDADEDGNRVSGALTVRLDCQDTLVISSVPEHLFATVGCKDLIVVHTADATLVCHASAAEDIKRLHADVRMQFGEKFL
jgi:mannose-1-phosphate guanylyltransferase